MPTSFLPSHVPAPAERPWFSRVVDIPVERVAVEVQVQTSGELTVLERIALRILEHFAQKPPSYAEAIRELGLGDAILLQASLAGLLQRGAVTATEASDLATYRLTQAGHQLLASASVRPTTARQGLHIHFDALTGEHFPAVAADLAPAPDHPVALPDAVRCQNEHLGLDRIRQLAQAQRALFLEADARIIATQTLREGSGILWQRRRVDFTLDAGGVLHVRMEEGGSGALQAWFDRLAPDSPLLTGLTAVTTAAWRNGHSRRLQPRPAAAWLGEVAQLIAPDDLVNQAQNLLRAAQHEIVADRAWLDLAQFEQGLRAATQRGLTCTVAEPDGLPEGLAPPPMAIVTDAANGLRVDQVAAQTAGGQPLTVEVAAFIRPDGHRVVREALLAATHARGAGVERKPGVLIAAAHPTYVSQSA